MGVVARGHGQMVEREETLLRRAGNRRDERTERAGVYLLARDEEGR